MMRGERGAAAALPAFCAMCLLSSAPLFAHTSARATTPFIIPSGETITIDGKVSPGEWNDVASFEIPVAEGWRVRVLSKHDAKNLYFAFLNLTHGKEMRFPELLFDPQDQHSKTWQPGEWWLHSSFNLCEGSGEYNVYDRSGIFQCAKTKRGWSGNHFPLKTGEAMEIEVSFAKLGLKYRKGGNIHMGFAIDLTDTQKHWTLWPQGAQLAHPNTWGEAFLR